MNNNDIIMNNEASVMNNLLTFSNNYIHYLNNSVNYLNNSISYLNNVMIMNNSYYSYYNNTNAYNNPNGYNNPNAYLLDYELDDFKKLSAINIHTLIASNSSDLYYGNIENPTNDTCAITHETFSNYDKVTMIKECCHIFNSCAIKQWLTEHQTCPNCRYNILTNSNIISYLEPENNKKIFLYTNEFKFYLALHIETLLSNEQANNEQANNEQANNEQANNEQANNAHEISIIL